MAAFFPEALCDVGEVVEEDVDGDEDGVWLEATAELEA